MKEELANELRSIFPKIFEYHPKLYFECDNGWFELLKDCITELKQELGEDNPLDIQVSQVKEKYGTLRFYTTLETDAVGKIIRKYEDKSEETCERCGNPGKLVGTGWYYTLCDDHATLIGV